MEKATDAMLLLAKMTTVETAPCWLWPTREAGLKGYARARNAEGEKELVHRLSFRIFVGPIPDALVVDHQCHNDDLTCPGGEACEHRRCFNPWHLRVVTGPANSQAGRSTPVLVNAAKTHCVNGHEFTPANTRVYIAPGKGRVMRQCRACDRMRKPAKRARRKAREEAARSVNASRSG